MLFDLSAICRNRQRLAWYKRHNRLENRLHRWAAVDLVDRLEEIRQSFSRPLIIGHRLGDVHTALTEKGRGDLASADLASAAVALDCTVQAETSQSLPVVQAVPVVQAPPDQLPFAPGSFDLILSSLYLHWAEDLPGLLKTARQLLKPDGLFVANMIGGHSLLRLRRALLTAESDYAGQASPRIIPMVDVPDAGRLLQGAGFILPMAERDRVCLPFKSFTALLKGIAAMGEGNALAKRTRHFSSRQLFIQAALAYQSDKIYEEEQNAYTLDFAESEQTPDIDLNPCRACFDIITLTGWAAPAQKS